MYGFRDKGVIVSIIVHQLRTNGFENSRSNIMLSTLAIVHTRTFTYPI